MKGSYNPGLGNVCDLLLVEFSSGMNESVFICFAQLGQALGAVEFP